MANYRGRGRPNNKANSPVRMATTERRRLVAAMYVKGMTQSQIAAELGVSVSRVSGDLKQIREEWRKEYLDKYDGLAIEQLRKLEAVEQEAWEAWHNSKGGKSGPNAKFINLVLKSIERRCKMLGLDAPERMQVLLSSHGQERDDHKQRVEIITEINVILDRLRGRQGEVQVTQEVNGTSPAIGLDGHAET